MNASNTTSAAIAPMIALNTKADGSNLCKISKPDAIAQPEVRLCAILRPLLKRSVAGYVLPRCQPEAKATPVCARCKAADLIQLREIFGAHGIENIPRKLSLIPMPERKTKPGLARGPPVDVGVREMASCFGQSDGPAPIPRKIDDCHFMRGQDSRSGVPVPMLAIDHLNSPNGFVFADLEAVVEFEERFGLRYDSIVVTGRS